MRWRTDNLTREAKHLAMDTFPSAPSRPARDSGALDDTWRALCEELRAAQRAKIDFLAELGKRACARKGQAGALLAENETLALAALQHAIEAVDERMRCFIADEALREPVSRSSLLPRAAAS